MLTYQLIKGIDNFESNMLLMLPNWDLPSVLSKLCDYPLEPMKSCDKKVLTWKTVFNITVNSIKNKGNSKVFQAITLWKEWNPTSLKHTISGKNSKVRKPVETNLVQHKSILTCITHPLGPICIGPHKTEAEKLTCIMGIHTVYDIKGVDSKVQIVGSPKKMQNVDAGKYR